MMDGRGAESLQAARDMLHARCRPRCGADAGARLLVAAPALSLVRFGQWQDVLREPAPPADLPLPTVLWHYARGGRWPRPGKLDEAEAERPHF